MENLDFLALVDSTGFAVTIALIPRYFTWILIRNFDDYENIVFLVSIILASSPVSDLAIFSSFLHIGKPSPLFLGVSMVICILQLFLLTVPRVFS